MQVRPSMQIFLETQTSCVAVKKDQNPAAQMSIKKEFELHLAAQPSPQLPNSKGDAQPEYTKSVIHMYTSLRNWKRNTLWENRDRNANPPFLGSDLKAHSNNNCI